MSFHELGANILADVNGTIKLADCMYTELYIVLLILYFTLQLVRQLVFMTLPQNPS